MGDKNPFAGTHRGERWIWRNNKNKNDKRELVVVEHDHELWLAWDYAVYAKVDEFPFDAALWNKGTFRRLLP